MSVVISDALARDLLWWVQNNPVPYVTVGEHYERWGRNQKPMMEIARDSMVEELKGAIDKPKVCLTIDEAKQVQQEFLDIVCEIVRVLGHYGVKYAKPASLIMLEERIEQAEGRK